MSKAVNWLLPQYKIVNNVFLLTFKVLIGLVVEDKNVRATFLLTSNAVIWLLKQLSLSKAVFLLTSKDVSWFPEQNRLVNLTKASIPTRLAMFLLEQSIVPVKAVASETWISLSPLVLMEETLNK
ncbi:hypothetical protein D3C86_1277990 [compost metagenome]